MKKLFILLGFCIVLILAVKFMRVRHGSGSVSSIQKAQRIACEQNIRLISHSLEVMSFSTEKKKKSIKELDAAILGQLPSCPTTKKLSYDWAGKSEYTDFALEEKMVVFCKYHGFATGTNLTDIEEVAIKKGLSKDWKKH
ncbi:hypothetical protein ACFL35_19705 [Candidatus Riflebacteria bacterium]